MTIRKFEQLEMEKLLEIVAEEFPVFVLGPGCYRVGFDNPQNPGWHEIEQRVAELMSRLEEDEGVFLRDLFFSKLSDERRSGPGRRAAADRLDHLVGKARTRWNEEREFAAASDLTAAERTPEALEAFGPWRTLLATEILRAFRHASCCLGLTIGEGLSPVLHWQEAIVPSADIAEWSKNATGFVSVEADAEEGAAHHFRASRRAIRAACTLTRTMNDLSQSRVISGDQVAALSSLSLTGVVDLEEAVPPNMAKMLDRTLTVLLPSRMATMLRVLDERCFEAPFEPLRGANVEWLGDLLWHVLSSDAEVQPSQSELGFYVALSEQRVPRLHDLRRSAYGDRTAERLDLTRLTTRGQPDDGSANPDVDLVLGTIAACLFAQYQLVELASAAKDEARARMRRNEPHGYTDEEAPFFPAQDRQVLALVGDYGDKLEQALFALLRSDGRFHIAVPTWLESGGTRKIDWLLATVKMDARRQPGVTWGWLAEADQAAGPIVVKLNGCDRPPLGAQLPRGNVSGLGIPSKESLHEGASMEPAVIYDEHDRLTAMQSFDELIGDASNDNGFVSALASFEKGLTWTGRSWVIMGQRFADWIPRLSLFTRKWAGTKDTKEATATNYWAIDRSFDWPERSLLESLGIAMIEGELATVAHTLTASAFEARRDRSAVGKQFSMLYGEVAPG